MENRTQQILSESQINENLEGCSQWTADQWAMYLTKGNTFGEEEVESFFNKLIQDIDNEVIETL